MTAQSAVQGLQVKVQTLEVQQGAAFLGLIIGGQSLVRTAGVIVLVVIIQGVELGVSCDGNRYRIAGQQSLLLKLHILLLLLLLLEMLLLLLLAYCCRHGIAT